MIVSLVIGIPAAYAAGRWKYKGCNDLMFQMLSFRFAPELMVIVPLFVIYNQIGLFDTKVGMIWVLQLVTMPLVVWILRSYFEDLPEDLEQAALLDGYTRSRAFVMVALPIVRPGIAAAALLAFIFAWNNYVFPLILADSNAGTVTVAITKFLGGGGQAYYNLTAAAAIIARPAATDTGADDPAIPGAGPVLRGGESLMATVSLTGLTQDVRQDHGRRRPRPRHRRRRVLRHPRPERRRQDDHAEVDRRPGRHRRRLGVRSAAPTSPASSRTTATSPWPSRATRSTRRRRSARTWPRR